MSTRIPGWELHWYAGLGWTLLLASALLAGCNGDVVETCPGFCPPAYSIAAAPESLINNLQTCYRRRDIEEYAKLLAPEFIFRFQPIDTTTVGTQFWTRDQDSTGTRALLKTTEVAEIRINLTYQGRDTTLNFAGTPLDTLRIRIVATDLQVDQTDGTAWVTSDQQDMFFRKGLAALGENPNYWWMYAWNDLPFNSSAGPPRGTEPTVGHGTTWGNLKTRYHL